MKSLPERFVLATVNHAGRNEQEEAVGRTASLRSYSAEGEGQILAAQRYAVPSGM
jgi:hypothetical protein